MNENTYKPRNYRIVRHVTKNRILDIQDSLDIGKLRIELVEFAEGEGATLSVEHYAEPDALALVCYDILQGRPWEKYVEFKGVTQADGVISRVLVIERVEARNPVKITVSRGPGKVMEKGAIQPLGKPEASLSVLLSEFDARRIALTLLRHMAAYEAATYHARVAAGTRRPAEPDAAEPDPRSEPAPRPEPAVIAPPPAGEAAPQPAAPAVAPNRRRATAPAVETYWMAARRLGVPTEEAERILADAGGDGGQAWSTRRRWRERQSEPS